MAIMVFNISQYLQGHFQPFVDDNMNRFETISMLVSMCTFACGLLTLNFEFVGNMPAVEKASSVALSINLVYLMVAMYFGAKIYSISKKRKAIRKAVKAILLKSSNAQSEHAGDVALDEKVKDTHRNEKQASACAPAEVELAQL